MKILSVRIKNLASLEGITEIDFTGEPLKSAGIFAITGPTGAGKSTILDALCLALYAKTPRYRTAEGGIDINDVGDNTIKQGDVRGILRDGTSDGFAEVDFEGVDKQNYRATWSVRRAYNRTDGSLQPFHIHLKNISTHTDIPGRKTEVLEEIERCVGLNFEQFTRSVLLAQGDFTAFLKAGKDEKSSLLEKLTGTHVYSRISKQVFEHYREQEQLLRDLRIRQENIAILPSEEIAKLLELKKESEAMIGVQQKEEALLAREINWHERKKVLLEEREKAGQVYEQALLARKEAEPRERQLDRITQFQVIKPTVDNLKYTREQLQSKHQQQKLISETLSALEQQKNRLDKQSDQAVSQLKSALSTQEETRPLIGKARDADIRIGTCRQQLEKAKKESEEAAGNHNRQKEKLATHTRNTEAIQLRVNTLDAWKKEHQSRKTVAEEQQFIISKLRDAGTLLRDMHTLQSQLQKLEQHLEQVREDHSRLSDKQKAYRDGLQALDNRCKKLQDTLSQTDITALEDQRDRLNATVTDLASAELQWSIWHGHLQDRERIAKKLDTARSEYSGSRKKLSATTRELEKTGIEFETSRKILEKARLTVAENVDRLRQNLAPSEPCPVCGSTEHPYATHAPLPDQLLGEMEAAHKTVENRHSDLLGTFHKLEQAVALHKKNIPGLETELSSTDEKIRRAEEKCRDFNSYAGLVALPEDRRSGWIKEEQAAQKGKLQHLERQVRDYHAARKQLDTEKEKLEQKRPEIAAVENALKDKEKERSLCEEQQATRQREKQKLSATLQQTRELLDPYFPSEEWYGHWQNDPETFIRRITDFAGEWKQRTEELNTRQRELEVARTSLKNLEEQLTLTGETEKRKTEQLAGLQSEYDQMLRERRLLLQGRSPDEVETELEKRVASAREEQERVKTAEDKLRNDLTRENARSEEVKKETERLREQEGRYMNEISSWLEAQQGEYSGKPAMSELEPLLGYSPEWIEEEHKALRRLSDAVNQASSVVTERQEVLDRHHAQRPSERSREEVTGLWNTARKVQEENRVRIAEVDYKLRDNETRKQGLSRIVNDIEKQQTVTDNWARLNEVIGSADGKKFRQIAQEYTLDVLLGYANVHLEILSKRYVLQRIPDSLGLQVLDRDMGDEVRTVYSLSGGESFLVSLALALGLASLSSTRMKVESLFIDEGFGSLDPATLNIAMDALERLHNQGRKVGVISHVQEMTERIPVRINVRKQRNGKSRVEVTGW
ncbi:AAA family ATPase [Sinomicrobium soli]|uniref:AAA family ATPase n=1 Tax=Sinomicrobium sp. N-1-3-6 TaxID=2219864 RepID=UPI000DCC24E3|nr:AAA family ATPase [Sinomicrobium sp. N-1-3-6]RAV28611.1 hypothetical protein DN748_11660 [Sinomicrobium sp. N-1-3-6]